MYSLVLVGLGALTVGRLELGGVFARNHETPTCYDLPAKLIKTRREKISIHMLIRMCMHLCCTSWDKSLSLRPTLKSPS